MVELLGMVCPFCQTEHFVFVPVEELIEYEMGATAQVAFQSLSVTEREQIISHICPDCQEKIFGQFKKSVDKHLCICYNKDTEKDRELKVKATKKSKKRKKKS